MIDPAGVIGQVTRVQPLLAEVTLVTDKDHAIPVQIVRNGLRGVAYGSGDGTTMELRHMAANAEVEKGDVLVTSGIDGVYPRGLPVARVARVERDAAYAFAKIVASRSPAPTSTGKCSCSPRWTTPRVDRGVRERAEEEPAGPSGRRGRPSMPLDTPGRHYLLLPAKGGFIFVSLLRRSRSTCSLGKTSAASRICSRLSHVLVRAPAAQDGHRDGLGAGAGNGRSERHTLRPACTRLRRAGLRRPRAPSPVLRFPLWQQALHVFVLLAASQLLMLGVADGGRRSPTSGRVVVPCCGRS